MQYLVTVIRCNREVDYFGPFEKFDDAQSAANRMPRRNGTAIVEPLYAVNRLDAEICAKIDT